MKKHILFIDPLEKLNLKKDSTLLLATTLKNQGNEVYLLFEQDLYVTNYGEMKYKVYDFEGKFIKDDYYLESFKLLALREVRLVAGDVLHMRLDPPFDTRYLKYLWLLKMMRDRGIVVINDPVGIMSHNEKLHAYQQPNSLESYVGASYEGAMAFINNLKNDVDDLILKPVDLYQGFGVEKIKRDDSKFREIFDRKLKESHGTIVIQPFVKEVEKGEIRAIYFNGIELGSILKVPKKGEFLANIAQGASYKAIELPANVKKECDRVARELKVLGVPWIAYDILGNHLSEINITCPGLLVEVSHAHNKNLALTIAELLR